jgi:hypothetical protein
MVAEGLSADSASLASVDLVDCVCQRLHAASAARTRCRARELLTNVLGAYHGEAATYLTIRPPRREGNCID